VNTATVTSAGPLPAAAWHSSDLATASAAARSPSMPATPPAARSTTAGTIGRVLRSLIACRTSGGGSSASTGACHGAVTKPAVTWRKPGAPGRRSHSVRAGPPARKHISAGSGVAARRAATSAACLSPSLAENRARPSWNSRTPRRTLRLPRVRSSTRFTITISGLRTEIAAYWSWRMIATITPAMTSGPRIIEKLNVGLPMLGGAPGARSGGGWGGAGRGARLNGTVPPGRASRMGSMATGGGSAAAGSTWTGTAPPRVTMSPGATVTGPVTGRPLRSVPLREPRSVRVTWPAGVMSSRQCSRDTPGAPMRTSDRPPRPTRARPAASRKESPAASPPTTRSTAAAGVPDGGGRAACAAVTREPPSRPDWVSGRSPPTGRPSIESSGPGRFSAAARSATQASGRPRTSSSSRSAEPSRNTNCTVYLAVSDAGRPGWARLGGGGSQSACRHPLAVHRSSPARPSVRYVLFPIHR